MDDDSDIDLPDRIDRRKSEYQGQNIQIFMSDDEPPDGKLHVYILYHNQSYINKLDYYIHA